MHLPRIIKLDNQEVISSSYVYGFQDFVRGFSKTNIFGVPTEKERGRHVYVLTDGHILFLKHPNKLFEGKL